MSDNETKKATSKNTTIGSVLIIIGLALAFFAYSHRPPEGFMDALQRGDSWVFKPGFYYTLLFIAALFGLGGVMRVLKGLKK